MKNKKTNILLIIISTVTAILMIAVIAMGVLLHRMYNNISLLGNKITYMSDSAEILLTDMDNLQTNIEATLEEETSLLESWDISLVDTDFAKKKYTLDVAIIPKEYTDATEVIVYFGTDEFALPKNGLCYEALITLPMGVSYEKKVTVLLTDGKKRNTEIIRGYKDVQHDFNSVLSGNITEMPVYEEGQLTIDGAVDFALDGHSDFEFTHFDLILAEGDTEIWSVDLKEKYQLKDNDAEPLNDAVIEERLTVQEKDTSMTSVSPTAPQSEEELLSETISELAGTYQLKKSFAIESGNEIRLYLQAKSKDGFTFEYDLFNGRTMIIEESSETAEEPQDGASQEDAAKEDAVQEEKNVNGFEESENYFFGNYSVYDQKGTKYEKN